MVLAGPSEPPEPLPLTGPRGKDLPQHPYRGKGTSVRPSYTLRRQRGGWRSGRMSKLMRCVQKYRGMWTRAHERTAARTSALYKARFERQQPLWCPLSNS